MTTRGKTITICTARITAQLLPSKLGC